VSGYGKGRAGSTHRQLQIETEAIGEPGGVDELGGSKDAQERTGRLAKMVDKVT